MDLSLYLTTGCFNVGFCTMGNKVVRHQRIAISDLTDHLNHLPKFLICVLISGIPSFIFDIANNGFAIKSGDPSEIFACYGFSFVAGLVFTPLFFLVATLVADGHPIGESYSIAYDALHKDWYRASWFGFVFLIIFLVSFCPCGLGTLVTMPMSYIIPSLAYRDMIGMRVPSFRHR